MKWKSIIRLVLLSFSCLGVSCQVDTFTDGNTVHSNPSVISPQSKFLEFPVSKEKNLPNRPNPTSTRSITLTGAPDISNLTRTIIIGQVVFQAEIALTAEERERGLSGRESLKPQTGMLFLFPTGRATRFWMKGMLIPLDFIWIDENCSVVDIDVNVLPPDPNTRDEHLPLYSSSIPATYTFEINTGDVKRFGIGIGDEVRFSDVNADMAGC